MHCSTADHLIVILQIRTTMAEPSGKPGIQDAHREGLLAEREGLKEELLAANKLPSRVVIHTNDKDLLEHFKKIGDGNSSVVNMPYCSAVQCMKPLRQNLTGFCTCLSHVQNPAGPQAHDVGNMILSIERSH